MPELKQEPTKSVNETTETEPTNKIKGLKEKVSKKNIVIVAVSVVLLLLTYNIGVGAGMDSDLSKARIEQDQILQDKADEIGKLDEEIKEKSDSITAAEKYYKDKSKLDEQLRQGKAELEKLYGEINIENTELEKVSGEVIKTKGNPIKLSAGHFTAGKDIATGRYKVTGDSNFAVYDGFGSLKVNTILGGKYGVESYVCELDLGDTLECSGSDTFTPIE